MNHHRADDGPAERASIVHCRDLDEAIARHEADGYRLDAIGPADAPNWAELSRADSVVLLDADPDRGPGRYLNRELPVPATVAHLTISHEQDGSWGDGRAGMAYRDLIPDRCGGAYIASHIHIPRGGPVPDYVHHHDVALQLIYCHRGWVRVVYQDQGPPFLLEPGDFVLQPPGIRHRVLESSDDLFVAEVSCPAEHPTFIDHRLELPNRSVDRDRIYGAGQRFLHHRGSEQPWRSLPGTDFRIQRTDLLVASNGRADLTFIAKGGPAANQGQVEESWSLGHDDDLLLLFVVEGAATLVERSGQGQRLLEGSSAAVPGGSDHRLIDIRPGTRLLELRCR